ncbi:ABC transporter permease [Agrobacterium sp. SORGH_AS 787]|uniref:ABC transporter permease n=1 Tax=Agrobacterium sp. SORGH_AS 787 TaxID=3041775 RepID=UPI0027874217|nr:simple sugar transport system permease protein [Rhizobium sp. SORGH_AS_0787]
MRKLFSPIKGRDPYIVILAVSTVLAFAVMAVTVPDRFLHVDNFASMAIQLSELGLFSVAMALSLIIGGIDLSVVAVANLAAIVAALVMRLIAADDASLAMLIIAFSCGLVSALMIGVIVGLINGMLVTRLGVPSILATLATMTLFTGISFGITGGSAISGLPEGIDQLGRASIFAIPAPFIAFAIIWFAVDLMLRKTRLGTTMMLVGASLKVARFSGIATGRIILVTHLLCSVIAALAGFISLLRMNSANADYGGTYVLLAILVSVLGGISVAGGAGRMIGVLISLVLLQFLSTGFNMLLLFVPDGNFFRDFVWGVLLLAIMALSHPLRRGKS